MLTSELPITERATSVLYHYTGVRPALEIVKNGEFQLSTVVGTTSEESYAPPGYPYFLSTTRSRTGDYHRYVGNAGVMFVLDGDYFNRHYKVKPIDYWERAWAHSPDRTRESEDRVFSREPTIPAEGIRAIHVLLKTQDDTRGSDTRRLLIAAKRSGIPIHLYQDEKAWRVQDVRRRLPIDQALELLQGKERSGVHWPRRNYLEQWVELIHKKATAELSEPARKLAFNLVYYNRGRGDDDMGLAQDLSNARKPGTDDHGTAITLIGHLKKYNYKVNAMVKALHDKWADISEQEHAAKKEKVSESQDIFEVKMSPGELRRWAESPEAEGIQAGFEAELIFRNTDQGEEEESEPDYDADERAYSIDSVVDFFQGGENGIGRNRANRLRDDLHEEFYNWQIEQVDAGWDDNEEDQVRDWMETNVWEEDQDLYRERAAEALGIETSEESADQSEAIEKRARELFDEDVETSIKNRDDEWQGAYDNYSDMMRDSSDLDEEAFFRDQYRYMSDVQNAHSLDWPYWTEGSSRSGYGRTSEEIADDLSSVLGDAEVKAGSGYHGVTRRPGRWIIEPDGSLDPDDSDDAGLEVVSPPMPLPETLEALKKVIDWANGEGDAYTNSSTGLHMGVSVPYKGGDVDYIKLVLFLGDEYVLDQFGRMANSYCRSALGKLRDVQRSRRERDSTQTADAMDLMRKNLIELTAKYVQERVGKDKYTSAHIKDGYIEFRSPGGDYLSQVDRDIGVLENTMLRFARAMHIASRPDLERKEYAKKLYKLIDAQNDEGLKLFLDYSFGKINRDQLKKEWAQQVLKKEQPAPAVVGQEYEFFNKNTGEVLDTIRADNEADLSLAIAGAIERFSGQGIDYDIRKKDEPPPKEPSRRAQIAQKIVTRPSIWHVENTNTGKILILAARNAHDAQVRAELQDPEFEKLRQEDPDSLFVAPATAAEVAQHRGENIPTSNIRSGGPRWRVTWTERRNGAVIDDAYTVDAENGADAMARIRNVLELQGRELVSISADPAPLAGSTLDRAQQRAAAGSQREYQIYRREDNEVVVGFMAADDQEALQRLEAYRQSRPWADVGVRTGGTGTPSPASAPAQPQGEWTGGWLIKDAQGQVLHRFHGIGNVQADANRHAAGWLGRNRPDLVGQDVEVVPEMR